MPNAVTRKRLSTEFSLSHDTFSSIAACAATGMWGFQVFMQCLWVIFVWCFTLQLFSCDLGHHHVIYYTLLRLCSLLPNYADTDAVHDRLLIRYCTVAYLANFQLADDDRAQSFDTVLKSLFDKLNSTRHSRYEFVSNTLLHWSSCIVSCCQWNNHCMAYYHSATVIILIA